MAFPLASVIYWFNKTSVGKWIWIVLLALNIYYTGWWIHQAHKGGFFQAGQMNRTYFLNVVGRINPDRDLFKLLETNEYFKGTPQSVNTVFQNDFEQDTAYCSTAWPSGGKATCLNGEIQFFGPITLPITSDCAPWIRVEADFLVQSREWDVWKYAQWIVQFYQEKKPSRPISFVSSVIFLLTRFLLAFSSMSASHPNHTTDVPCPSGMQNHRRHCSWII